MKYNIKPFQTPYNKYIYDVNTNVIQQISTQLFELIDQNGDVKTIDTLDTEIENLKKKGLLTLYQLDKLENIPNSNLQYYLSYKVNSIILQVTQKCNFNCTYCAYSPFANEYQRSMSNKKMTWEIAREAIDFVYNHSEKSEILNFGFYGGEPLLEYKLIKDIILYIENRFDGKPIIYNMTTNGYLMTPEVIDFLAKKNVMLTISLDGPKEINDAHRRLLSNGAGTFDVVVNNIKYLKENYYEYYKKIKINMVIDTRENYIKLNEIDKNDVLNDISIRTSVIDDSYSKKKLYMSEEYIINSNYSMFLGYLYLIGRLEQSDISHIVASEVEKIKIDMGKLLNKKNIGNTKMHGGPCIPGYNRLMITTDGNIYPCEKVSESAPCMNIGDIQSGFNMENIHKMLESNIFLEDQCKKCWAIHLCGQCPKTSENYDCFSKEKKRSYCKQFRAKANKLVRLYLMILDFAHRNS